MVAKKRRMSVNLDPDIQAAMERIQQLRREGRLALYKRIILNIDPNGQIQTMKKEPRDEKLLENGFQGR